MDPEEEVVQPVEPEQPIVPEPDVEPLVAPPEAPPEPPDEEPVLPPPAAHAPASADARPPLDAQDLEERRYRAGGGAHRRAGCTRVAPVEPQGPADEHADGTHGRVGLDRGHRDPRPADHGDARAHRDPRPADHGDARAHRAADCGSQCWLPARAVKLAPEGKGVAGFVWPGKPDHPLSLSGKPAR